MPVTWKATPFNPHSIPLAVRSPYISTWLPQGDGAALNAIWSRFWTGHVTGWSGFIKVDGTAYSFLGAPGVPGATFHKATQKSFTFTSTQSIFVMSAGPVDLTVTFLSPVEPTDLVKQSIPFSYMALSAVPTDNCSHHVQVYSDISAEWASGDDNAPVDWATTIACGVLTHRVQKSSSAQVIFGEDHNQAAYGSCYYSTPNTVAATYQTGQDTIVRAQFINHGTLLNTQDTQFRKVSDRWPVFALAHDLGTVTCGCAHEPIVYSIGHVRDPAIEYITEGGVVQRRSSYFWSKFSNVDDLISSFLGDYSAALSRANKFDTQINADACKISSDYASIVALSVRQALATTEITISRNTDRSWNTDDVLAFMKELSTGGHVSTVDVIFPAWPVFLYTNPLLGKYLLLPILQYQASGQYPNKWCAHDIGATYPKALGHKDGKDLLMPVEETGNMLIMVLSYIKKTGDTSLLVPYRNLLDQWARFLITDSLFAESQTSTDNFAGALANQTGLAIKGIIGIGAMSEIAHLLDDAFMHRHYRAIADLYVSRLQELATAPSRDHLTLAYKDTASWGLGYNLFGDKLLKLDLFPASVYNMQTAWYRKQAKAFGVPLDTRHTYTKSDWEIWTAGIVTDNATRDILISSVKKWAANGLTNVPLGDWYDATTGKSMGFKARPVVGGHLALLVL